MTQANVLSFGILVVSFCFLMIPSTFVGVVELAGLPIFKMIGPFYIIGLLLAGVANSVIYMTFHAEIKQAAIRLIKFRSFNTETTSTAMAPTTVYDF
uniref:Uncharacterized protein n=1 Tax=Panagrolaimus sp. JU765 TaxID=591449 RepID=A0AC34RFQ9_9BILA